MPAVDSEVKKDLMGMNPFVCLWAIDDFCRQAIGEESKIVANGGADKDSTNKLPTLREHDETDVLNEMKDSISSMMSYVQNKGDGI